MLQIYGIGTYLPPSRAVRDVVAACGGDARKYQGWDNIGWAEGDDHPSTMAAASLRDALAEADLSPEDLKLVVYAGVSRDYQPAWSVATEVMGLCDVPASCVGLDLAVGCLGTLAALQTAAGWLASAGGGCAAVVTAERWAFTVDRSRKDLMGLWGHGDGAGALVVGLDDTRPAALSFLGAEFSSNSALNGRVLVKYGGTRYPEAPPGVPPYLRGVGAEERAGVRNSYVDSYARNFDAIRRRFGVTPRRLVCNQVGTRVVEMLPEVAGVAPEDTVVSGHDHGHLGGGDVIVGLQRLAESDRLDEPILVGGSAAFAFGAGLIVPGP